jgi:hypothetical protein
MSLLVSGCLSALSGYVHLLFCLQVPMDSLLIQVRHSLHENCSALIVPLVQMGTPRDCVDLVTLLHHLHLCIQCPHLVLCLQTLTASGMPAATRPSQWMVAAATRRRSARAWGA